MNTEGHGLDGCDLLMSVSDLAVSFSGTRVVDGVRFAVSANETLAIVGESGSGKSITALALMRLLPRNATVESGRVMYGGRDLLALPVRDMLRVRGGELAMIFQEPMTSLNPVMSVGQQIAEAVRLHQSRDRKGAGEPPVVRSAPNSLPHGRGSDMQRAGDALEAVGIPRARLRDYPHQFSGGMRQRVMIAMALACEPRVLIADEPTTALDVSVQQEILDLIQRIQRERGMGVILITHDLGLVAQRADHVCVMYHGRIVESSPVKALFADPQHPYTRALLACRPCLRKKQSRLTTVAESLSTSSQ